MPPAPRHSRPKTPRKPAVKIGVPVLAAATLAGVAAAFVFLTGGSAGSAASTSPSHSKITAASSASSLTSDDMMIDVHHQVAARTVRDTARTIRRHYLAKLAAARLAQKKAAEKAAEQAAKQQAAAAAQPSPSPSPAASSSGSSSDAAHSALGVCIRNAEEGGSYAWGPGNGGGAYQFVLGTWENYGGSASEFGVAGPAYQDQIFDNAIAAGGASNWTAYDGC
jgi:uncharacterized protein (DUF305 family)